MEFCCCSSSDSKGGRTDELPALSAPDRRSIKWPEQDDLLSSTSNHSEIRTPEVSHLSRRSKCIRQTQRCSPGSLRYLFVTLLAIASLQYVSSYSKFFTSSNGSINANVTEPIFVINFDMAAVICQGGSDARDLRVHDLSALCDGKLDCAQGVGINDENFPFCESGCEAECSGRGACLRDGPHTKCFYNTEHREDNTDCGDQSCHWLARCEKNPLGQPECKCFDGFTGNGHTCTDLDECASGVAKCSTHATCINLPGSYACSCGLGYRLSGIHPSTTCEDIDECATGSNHCEPYEKCQNTEGSYVCVRNCGAGYALSTSGDRCEDVDECAASHSAGVPICDARAECVNKLGGFECRCEDGFSGDGKICAPVADCTVNEHVCDRRAECVPLLKTCVCREGYTGDGAHCQDVNECERSENVCDIGHKCVNIDGGFLCCDAAEDSATCRQREGAFCPGGCGQNAVCYEDSCRCISGYIGNPKSRCDDIDECVHDVCSGVSERCMNLPGGHICCAMDSELAECQGGIVKTAVDTEDGDLAFSVNDHPRNVAAGGAFNGNSVLAAGGAVAKAQAQAEAAVKKGGKQSHQTLDNSNSTSAAEQASEKYHSKLEVRQKKVINGGYVLLTRHRSPSNTFDKQVDLMEPQKCDLQARASTCPINALCVDGLCKCHAGFGWNIATKLCEDIDECKEDVQPCAPSRFCVNTIGGYRCCSISGDGPINRGIHGIDLDSNLVNCSGINISAQNFRTVDALRHSVQDLISLVDHDRGETRGSLVNSPKNSNVTPEASKNESIIIDGAMSSLSEELNLPPGAPRSGQLTTVTYGEWHNFTGGQVIIRRGSTGTPGLEFRPVEFGNRKTEEPEENKSTETPPFNKFWTMSPSIENKPEPKVIWSDGDEPEDEETLQSVSTSTTDLWEKTSTEDTDPNNWAHTFPTVWSSTSSTTDYTNDALQSSISSGDLLTHPTNKLFTSTPLSSFITKIATMAPITVTTNVEGVHSETTPLDNIGLEIVGHAKNNYLSTKRTAITTTVDATAPSTTQEITETVEASKKTINSVITSTPVLEMKSTHSPDNVQSSRISNTPKSFTIFTTSDAPTAIPPSTLSSQAGTDFDESNIGLEISFLSPLKQSTRAITMKSDEDTTTFTQIGKSNGSTINPVTELRTEVTASTIFKIVTEKITPKIDELVTTTPYISSMATFTSTVPPQTLNSYPATMSTSPVTTESKVISNTADANSSLRFITKIPSSKEDKTTENILQVTLDSSSIIPTRMTPITTVELTDESTNTVPINALNTAEAQTSTQSLSITASTTEEQNKNLEKENIVIENKLKGITKNKTTGNVEENGTSRFHKTTINIPAPSLPAQETTLSEAEGITFAPSSVSNNHWSESAAIVTSIQPSITDKLPITEIVLSSSALPTGMSTNLHNFTPTERSIFTQTNANTTNFSLPTTLSTAVQELKVTDKNILNLSSAGSTSIEASTPSNIKFTSQMSSEPQTPLGSSEGNKHMSTRLTTLSSHTTKAITLSSKMTSSTEEVTEELPDETNKASGTSSVTKSNTSFYSTSTQSPTKSFTQYNKVTEVTTNLPNEKLMSASTTSVTDETTLRYATESATRISTVMEKSNRNLMNLSTTNEEKQTNAATDSLVLSTVTNIPINTSWQITEILKTTNSAVSETRNKYAKTIEFEMTTASVGLEISGKDIQKFRKTVANYTENNSISSSESTSTAAIKATTVVAAATTNSTTDQESKKYTATAQVQSTTEGLDQKINGSEVTDSRKVIINSTPKKNDLLSTTAPTAKSLAFEKMDSTTIDSLLTESISSSITTPEGNEKTSMAQSQKPTTKVTSITAVNTVNSQIKATTNSQSITDAIITNSSSSMMITVTSLKLTESSQEENFEYTTTAPVKTTTEAVGLEISGKDIHGEVDVQSSKNFTGKITETFSRITFSPEVTGTERTELLNKNLPSSINSIKSVYPTTAQTKITTEGVGLEISEKDNNGKETVASNFTETFGRSTATQDVATEKINLLTSTLITTIINQKVLTTARPSNNHSISVTDQLSKTTLTTNNVELNIHNTSTTSTPTTQLIDRRITTTDYTEVQSRLNATTGDKSSNEVGLEIGPNSKETESPDVGLEIRGGGLKPIHPNEKNSSGKTTKASTIESTTIDGIEINGKLIGKTTITKVITEDGENPDETTKEEQEKLEKLKKISFATTTVSSLEPNEISPEPKENGLEISPNKFPSVNGSVNAIDESGIPDHNNKEDIGITVSPVDVESTTQSSISTSSVTTEGVGLEISGKSIVKSINKSTGDSEVGGSVVKGTGLSGSSSTIIETKESKHVANSSNASSRISSTTKNPIETKNVAGLEINGNGAGITTAEPTPTTEGVGLEISGKDVVKKEKESTESNVNASSTTEEPLATTEGVGLEINGKNIISRTKSSSTDVVVTEVPSSTTTTTKPGVIVEETTEENVENGLEINGGRIISRTKSSSTDVVVTEVPSSTSTTTTTKPEIIVEETTEENVENGLEIHGKRAKSSTQISTPVEKSTTVASNNVSDSTTSSVETIETTSIKTTESLEVANTTTPIASSTVPVSGKTPETTSASSETTTKATTNSETLSTIPSNSTVSSSIEPTSEIVVTVTSKLTTTSASPDQSSTPISSVETTTKSATTVAETVPTSPATTAKPTPTVLETVATSSQTEPPTTAAENVEISSKAPENSRTTEIFTIIVPTSPSSLSPSPEENSSSVESSGTTTNNVATTELFTIHVPGQVSIITTVKPPTGITETSTSTAASTAVPNANSSTSNPPLIIIDHGEKATEEGNGEDLLKKTTATVPVTVVSTLSATVVEVTLLNTTSEPSITTSSASSTSSIGPVSSTTTVPSSTTTVPLVHETENKTGGCQSSDECGMDAHCDQQTGACHCNIGFRGQPPSVICTDVDECVEKFANCHSTAQCQNAIGGFMCVCPPGYRKDADGSCKDIDECTEQGAIALCAEAATCENLPGFYACRCNAGFTGDGYKCVETGKRACTPAEWTASDCGRNHLCHVDAHGRIDCETCKRGFHIANGVCSDIDECEEPAGSAFAHKCHADARCVNLDGGYTCQCAPGYAGDGFHCEDIDECNAPMASSSQMSSLSGADLSTSEEPKETGEQPSLEVNGSSLRIESPNNSTTQVQRCHPKAECNNTPGAFECRCVNGWLGDGIAHCAPEQGGPQLTCDASTGRCGGLGNMSSVCYAGLSNAVADDGGLNRVICECRDGFRYNPADSGCIDVDECTERRDVCERASGAVCRNLEGGYICECTVGYEGANGNCRDVDECARGTADCHANAYCVNSPGGFSCHCAHGYRGDGVNCSPITTPEVGGQTTAKTPNGGDVAETKASECSDDWLSYCRALNQTCHIDEEEVAQCGSCLFGYQPMNGRCRQIDEFGNCADPSKNNCNVNADCIDVNPGRHFCTCKEGFIGDGLRCDDVNECTIPGLCDPHATCRNANGTFECLCQPGYQGNGFQCKEAPPAPTPEQSGTTATTVATTANCRRNPTVCHPNAFCDWDGVCQCGRGFKGDGIYYCNKVTVTDIDEKSAKKTRNEEDELLIKQTPKALLTVASSPHTPITQSLAPFTTAEPSPQTTTITLAPSYPRCGSAGGPSDGRDISGYVEIPIDGGAKCHALATCDFSRGDANGGVCVCNPGYEGDGYTTCTPTWKDCRANPSICHYYAKCDNQTGDCLCGEGFLGDGINSCLPDSWDCESRGPSLCNVQATCVNRRCSCRPGFIGDGITCMPVQPPEGSGANCIACHCHARCNTGTRRCECIEGYLGNGLMCVPDPMNCAHYPALCHPAAKCNNATGACQCQNGYSGDGRTCRRVSTCLTNAGLCGTNAHCRPSGSCRCDDGYFGDGHVCSPAVSTTTTTNPTTTTVIALATTTNALTITTAATTVPVVQKVGDLGVECLADGIRVHITNQTSLPYGARIFVQGQSNDPYCSKTFAAFNNSTNNDGYFDVSSAHCNTQLEANNTVTITVILQKHATLQTAEAVAYHLSCSYPIVPTTASAQFNVTERETETLAIAGAGPPPACALAVTSARTDAPASAATVGEVLKLSLSVEPRQLYAVLPRNCYAINVASGERYALTDAAGCAVDTAIFPEWSRVHTYLAQALFRTFKWPDTSSIRFECDCSACVGICPTVNCGRRRDAAADYRRRMRLRFARQNADASDTVSSDALDAEDSWLAKFARRGARLALSSSVDVSADAKRSDLDRFILGDKSVERHALSAGTIPWLALALACGCLIVAAAVFAFVCLCMDGIGIGRQRVAKAGKADGWRRAMAPSSERSFATSTASTRTFDTVSEGDNRSSYITFK